MFRAKIVRWALAFLTLLPASLPAEVRLQEGQLAPGTKWETPYFVTDSGVAGPTVVLTGGLHGDEPAGSRAAEQIRHWPILKGRLVVLPRINQAGLVAGTRLMPGVENPNQDLNRNFPKSKTPDDAHGELARAVWSFVRDQKPQWVIDLHEGYHFHQIQSKSVGSSIIDSKSEAANAVVPAMLERVNAGIRDQKKEFVRLRYAADGSLARAAAEHLGASSMILETTTREQPLSYRTRQHRLMVHTLLAHLGMIAPEAPNLTAPTTDPTSLRVAIYDAGGAAASGPKNLQAVLKEIPKSLAWRIGPKDIREGALKLFDLVVFPGGSGSKQAGAIGQAGREEVRTYVENGGGFVGVCAGAYLAASNYKWSLAISNHKTFCERREVPGVGSKSMWYRGPSSTVRMELTEEGKDILGNLQDEFPVRYHNGPIVSPANREGLPGYRVLAHYRSEVAHYEVQAGTMVNTPAIIAAEFGKGRVLCISPHPESSKKLRPMVARGLRWAAGQ